MVCCCKSLGDCTQGSRSVPRRCIADLTSRLHKKIRDTMTICDGHLLYFTITLPKTCVSCDRKKPGRLRPASRWIPTAHPGDKICRKCQDLEEITIRAEKSESDNSEVEQKVPQLTKSQISKIKKLMTKEFYIMPVMAEWCEKIFSGEKKWNYVFRAIAENIEEKIVLLRAMTDDGKCFNVVGAVVLGAYDENAPQDASIGYDEDTRPFGHPIEIIVEFSRYRTFSQKTYANGYPKTVTSDHVKEFATYALQQACGLRSDI